MCSLDPDNAVDALWTAMYGLGTYAVSKTNSQDCDGCCSLVTETMVMLMQMMHKNEIYGLKQQQYRYDKCVPGIRIGQFWAKI